MVVFLTCWEVQAAEADDQAIVFAKSALAAFVIMAD
jgi:hypothetical protein